MGRTKLKALEIAGVKVAIEVPSNFEWQWPDRNTELLSCSPIDPDVHIGVRIGKTKGPTGETFLYESHGVQFEIGWEDETWIVAVHGTRKCERTARFDSDFRFGEIVISPEFAQDSHYPLEHPLEELVFLHRLIREGCMVLHGTVSVRGGQALVNLNARGDSHGQSGPAPGMSPRNSGYVVLRPVLEASAGETNGVWVHSTPWGSHPGEPDVARTPLAAIHVVGATSDSRIERLSGITAQNEILQYAFAPIHDPHAADRLFEIIGRVVRKTSVIRMNQPKSRKNLSFDWDVPTSGMGFAAPSL